ncbi:MAG: wax ester/triacylglycerol synthase family O-acyltransferase [Marinobacter sp.]|uniref:wax ester/triacylglycerol synthase family O-acyltransferase n=1 Tax=Marinobacter sp. TaxID=50741 RepID=UPI00299DCDBC|nr:wax ester/triacylglycerol synthase family O-acyltransferase [Marinobacter sp.]MDX1636009.1 wax ester/triacylglycerol synthase family O-acyltransferase [Marinobacter sp.]
MTSQGSRMAAVDRSWLRMECTENPMMISAVLVFEQPIAMKKLRRVLNDRLLRFRRFRQRVEQRGERTEWRDDPLFDLDNHVHTIALPGNADKTDLQNLVSDLNSTPLNPDRPLWQLHYIDHYEGGCALMVRIHHCIADGISLVRVLLSLTDDSPEAKVRQLKATNLDAETRPPAIQPDGLIKRYTGRLLEVSQTSVDQVRLFKDSVMKDPSYPLRLATTAGKVAMECIKLGLTPEEPATPLKQALTGRKRVAWAEPLSLAEVKLCARALGGTANDVLMTAATGALHRHFRDIGEPIPDCGLRVAVPFNLRPIRQPIEELGNKFGLVLVSLPVDVDCPIMCFRQVQEHMNRLKQSYQAQVTYSLLDLFGRGPDILERRALKLLSSKASAVLTNVPGPKNDVYLGGARLKQPMFWVPQTGDIGIGMSIFSYAGTVQFGITIDKGIKADPVAVMAHFRESFSELRDKALHRQANDSPDQKAV